MHRVYVIRSIALLTSLSKLVLKEGGIDYISYDNLGATLRNIPMSFDFSTNWAVNFTSALLNLPFYCSVFIY